MQNATHNAIVVFDSGVGGLSLLKTLQKHLAHEKLLYLADQAFFPYGDKPEADIQARVLFLAKYLEKYAAKAFVLACNTASAAAADQLRQQCKMPIIAMEPAIKPAVLKSKTGVVAVLATSATLNSRRFFNLCARFAHHAQILLTPCPGLVQAIESQNKHVLNAHLTKLLLPLQKQKPDVIVLGCSHYPWIKNEIAAFFPADVLILDTSEAVSRQVARCVPNLLKMGKSEVHFVSTQNPQKMQNQLQQLGFGAQTVLLWQV